MTVHRRTEGPCLTGADITTGEDSMATTKKAAPPRKAAAKKKATPAKKKATPAKRVTGKKAVTKPASEKS